MKHKIRYSNFHRARKWHRKFRNVLYDPNGVKIWLVDHYSDLFYKYYAKANVEDHIPLGFLKIGGADSDRLVIIWPKLTGYDGEGNPL